MEEPTTHEHPIPLAETMKELATYEHPGSYVVIPIPVRDRIMARLRKAEEDLADARAALRILYYFNEGHRVSSELQPSSKEYREAMNLGRDAAKEEP